ncbi:phosphate-starvation-inducible PsiE family protein [Desulfopila sp. IMCC35008]|uniref:phosphate-starvation-inducible PsiE family protein n=1 Tax=Desulfopila sp. IMCC35008 TaxID=2653858 RepID=UPI0013D8671A|nr:phosphate-starvation-inducible PsiE family protein [Desulfopila sp. IMCC35008]
MQQVQKENDPFLYFLKRIIHYSLKMLAALMILVIIFGVIDVGWTLYERLKVPPYFILTMGDVLATFGAFMVVLIAIEIFQNIILYLRDDVIHVKIVLATALMAVARKVIILDYSDMHSLYVFATGVVLLATGLVYYLVHKIPEKEQNTH